MFEQYEISAADWQQDIGAVREMFREYQTWLNVDVCFQAFDLELTGLPGKYEEPSGVVYIARSPTVVAGIIGMIPTSNGDCEMKRLYVREQARGYGVGKKLADAAVTFARRAGYTRIVLETLPQLQIARDMYLKMGFLEIERNGGSEPENVIRMVMKL